VENDELRVTRGDDVLLEKIRAHPVSERLGRESVLG
jgi:hypothetical protein